MAGCARCTSRAGSSACWVGIEGSGGAPAAGAPRRHQYSSGSSGVSTVWVGPASLMPCASLNTTPDSKARANRLGSAIAALEMSPRRQTNSEGCAAASRTLHPVVEEGDRPLAVIRPRQQRGEDEQDQGGRSDKRSQRNTRDLGREGGRKGAAGHLEPDAVGLPRMQHRFSTRGEIAAHGKDDQRGHGADHDRIDESAQHRHAVGVEPWPASFENSPRATPARRAMIIAAPANPPTAADGLNAL